MFPTTSRNARARSSIATSPDAPMGSASNRKRNLIVAGVVAVLLFAVAGAVVVSNASSNNGMKSPVPVDGYFKTLPVGAALPSEAECAARVHRSPWEPRRDNTKANNTKPPQPVELADDPAYNDTFQKDYKPRVTGNFTGTT